MVSVRFSDALFPLGPGTRHRRYTLLMDRWLAIALIGTAALPLMAGGAALWPCSGRRALSPAMTAFLRDLADDLARLPGRLRRVAADPRTPRRARWLLVLLAIYTASLLSGAEGSTRSRTSSPGLDASTN